MGRAVALTCLVWASLVSTALAQAPESRPGASAGEPCRDALGRTPVVEAGREGDVRSLLAPHVVGAPVGESGWTLDKVSIEHAAITVHLSATGGVARLVLSPAACDEQARERSLSFALERFEDGGEGHATAALDALVAAIQAHDKAPFYKVRMGAPPPVEVQEASALLEDSRQERSALVGRRLA